jgi:hypothetical protein
VARRCRRGAVPRDEAQDRQGAKRLMVWGPTRVSGAGRSAWCGVSPASGANGIRCGATSITCRWRRSTGRSLVARRHLLPNAEHRQSLHLNNHAENSQGRPDNENDRCSASEQARMLFSAPAFIHGHFHPRRHRMAATAYRAIRFDASNG